MRCSIWILGIFFCSFVSLSFPLSILLYAFSYNQYLSSLNF